VMTLQTALLLREELENLGAEVRLTREELVPVSPRRPEELDLGKFARLTLLESADRSWFRNLVLRWPVGPELFREFERSGQVRSLFEEFRRGTYFIGREDLDARIGIAREFEPDLILVIHFDAVPGGEDSHGVSPRAYNYTKAYVPG